MNFVKLTFLTEWYEARHLFLYFLHLLTEGYAAGHCPYLDQCVFTHMDAQDVLAWLKVVPESSANTHIYFSAFPGRLQPALPDQQSPLHAGDAHQLVPGGESGVDISAIYIKYISNIKNISAIYEKYISHISQGIFWESIFFRGMLWVSFWTGWRRRRMSSLSPELRLSHHNHCENWNTSLSFQALLWMTDPKPLSQIKLVESCDYVNVTQKNCEKPW